MSKHHTVKEITAKCGVTTERKGTWYKMEYSETREIHEDFYGNIEEERADLWDAANIEVNKQLDELDELTGVNTSED